MLLSFEVILKLHTSLTKTDKRRYAVLEMPTCLKFIKHYKKFTTYKVLALFLYHTLYTTLLTFGLNFRFKKTYRK